MHTCVHYMRMLLWIFLQRMLSFYWIPSDAITFQRLTFIEVGSGWSVPCRSESVMGSQGWSLRSYLHYLVFPVILAQCFSSFWCQWFLQNLSGDTMPLFPAFFPFWCLYPIHQIFLLMKAFFFLFPFLTFSSMAGCPGDSGSWPCLHQVRCISFYSCLSSAVVAQDSPCLRRLPSESAISPASGLICVLTPQPFLHTCPLTGTCVVKSYCGTQHGPDSATSGHCSLSWLPSLWISIPRL